MRSSSSPSNVSGALAARCDRRPRLHARARRGPLRHPAPARARLHRPQGRHLRRHRRRARASATRPRRPARALRLARGHLRERRFGAGREAARDADRAPRGRGALEAAGNDRARPPAGRRPRRGARRSARPRDDGRALPPLRVPRYVRRVDELEAAVPGAALEREDTRSAPSAETPARSPRCWLRTSRSAWPGTGPDCSAWPAASRRC